MSDLLGAAAVLVASAIIATTGFARADPLASLTISLLIIPRTVKLLREAVDVLLEATPKGVDLDDVRSHILGTEGVTGCHDLHAWTITSGVPVLSAHVVVDDTIWTDGTAAQVLDRLASCLYGHFDVGHSTLQIEQDAHADTKPSSTHDRRRRRRHRARPSAPTAPKMWPSPATTQDGTGPPAGRCCCPGRA